MQANYWEERAEELYRGRAMLQHEWAGSTGVIPRPHRKPGWNNTCVVFRRVSEGTGCKTVTPLVTVVAAYHQANLLLFCLPMP